MIKVLLADDQELIRQSLSFVMSKQEDIEMVGTAANGREALELVEEKQPDVVLLDIRMPEMDGVECTRRIKQEFPGIKVIILTTFENQLAACAALAGSGFFALLTQLPAADLPGLIPGYLVWLNDFSGTLASFSDTQVQLFTLFSQVGQGTFASLLGDLFSLPLLLWLTPYRRVAHAAFYDARQAMPEAAAQDLPPL